MLRWFPSFNVTSLYQPTDVFKSDYDNMEKKENPLPSAEYELAVIGRAPVT